MQFSRIEIVVNFIFWILVTWIFVYGNASMDVEGIQIIDGQKKEILVRNHTKVKILFATQFLLGIFFYVELFLIHKLKTPKAIKGFIIKSIGLIFLTASLYISLLLYIGVSNKKDLPDGNTIVLILFFYITVVTCYGFTKKWLQYERDKKNLELIKNRAELNLLKQQLQPHFLFNTMNNLLAMVNQTDNPKLAESIHKLSGLLRYVVYDTKNEKVPIQEEIIFIQNFIELHLLRFEDDEIDFKIDISGEYDTQLIEPGIFLCYVENAFKHGVQPEENSFINIYVDISTKDRICFTIENSIPKIPFENKEGGFGLQSNQERLDLAYVDKYKLTFEKNKTYIVQLTLDTND
ncbi:sensor histidine kinase [Aquimarina litoralis]|uniref:sensor histidine kinase n=1 Tax=Aquimarina litoralis TaxID=584605 RepID=UPI001C57632F|nr:sensor histidine kinase [Aquimarina litoralis]MBW1295401.1 hypothetical protein [Aquimarina litoralis]